MGNLTDKVNELLDEISERWLRGEERSADVAVLVNLCRKMVEKIETLQEEKAEWKSEAKGKGTPPVPDVPPMPGE